MVYVRVQRMIVPRVLSSLWSPTNTLERALLEA
jgi:hypothetical protein